MPDMWIRWAQGFQLGGARTGAVPRAMGQLSSRETFGHNGSNACMAWADPTRSLVFAYVSDRVEPNMAGIRHQSATADTLLSAYRP
jgi:CubicO group peptidase (beta-lactamase class C family)